MALMLAPQCCCLTCEAIFARLGFANIPPNVTETAATSLTMDLLDAKLTNDNCTSCGVFNNVFIDPTVSFIGNGILSWRVNFVNCGAPFSDFVLCQLPCPEAVPMEGTAFVQAVVVNAFGQDQQARFTPRDFDTATITGRQELWNSLFAGEWVYWTAVLVDHSGNPFVACHDDITATARIKFTDM